MWSGRLYPSSTITPRSSGRCGADSPPRTTDNVNVDKEARISEMLPGGQLEEFYFGYVKQWWSMRHEKNVLLLHYKDAFTDLPGTVTKLAMFLGVKLTKKEHRVVTERCGMKHMKSIEHRFDIRLPLNKVNPEMVIVKRGKVLRAGGLGQGNELFNDGCSILVRSVFCR